MQDKSQRFNSGRANFFLLVIMVTVIFAAVLKITAAVLLPFTVSVLLALAINPVVKFLEKLHIPRIAAVLLILVLLVCGFVFLGIILFRSGRAILALYPKYEARLTEIYVWVARVFELPYDAHLSVVDNLWGQLGVRSRVRVMTLSFSNAFIVFLSNAVMVAIFMVFLHADASFFRKKIDKAFKGARSEQIKKISSDIMTQVTRYLSIKFIFSVACGVMVGIGLKIVGVEFAAIWGLLQFVLNFIPNVGSIALGVAVTAFSLIQFWPDPTPVVITGLVMLVINLVLGSFLDPKVMGDNLGISPLVVLVSLLIWGWLWGFIGLIIAVPMMVIIKIVFENIPMLEPISILLGSRKAVLAARSGDEGNAQAKEEIAVKTSDES